MDEMPASDETDENESAPSALPPPPRRVRRIRGFGTLVFARLIALPIVVAMVLFIIFALLVATYGTRVEGRIHEIYVKTFSDGQHFEFARYSYELDGVTHNDEQRVDGGRFSNLKANDPIAIRTVRLVGRIRYSTLADGPKAFLDLYVIPIITLLTVSMIVASVVAHRGWLVPARHLRVVQHGVETPGTVTDVSLLPGRTVSYTYTVDQLQYTGSTNFRGTFADQPRLGQRLTVIYDPKRPHRHVVYEFCDFEIVR